MRYVTVAAAIVLAACNYESPKDTATDTRIPIAVEYVRGPALTIHAKTSDDAAVVTKYQHGESVSVLSRHGVWAEVRTASGSGWAHSEELADTLEAAKAEADNTKAHFIRAPQPVTQPGAHGELLLEADVSTDGLVVNVRTITNTTGSSSLEQRNTSELRQAVFTPVVRHGRRESFIYEHHLQY